MVWCKTNAIPACNNVWLPNVEYCLVFKGEGTPRYNDGYELKSKWFLSPINVYDKEKYNHPTIKPLELVKRHILHSTKENDIVADFFSGSGTTLVACKETKRQYIGFEIDSKYVEITKDRLNGINQKGEIDLFNCEQLDEINERLDDLENNSQINDNDDELNAKLTDFNNRIVALEDSEKVAQIADIKQSLKDLFTKVLKALED